MVKKESEHSLKMIRTDKGGEFTSMTLIDTVPLMVSIGSSVTQIPLLRTASWMPKLHVY